MTFGFFREREKWAIRLAYSQAIFYLITGLWPLLDIGTFLIATGPKTDLWLVRTVGGLVTCTGVVLLLAARFREVNRSVAILAVTNAITLSIIDIVYVSLNVIAPIYLVDAVVEGVILFSWLVLWPSKSELGEKGQAAPLNRFDREVDLSDVLS